MFIFSLLFISCLINFKKIALSLNANVPTITKSFFGKGLAFDLQEILWILFFFRLTQPNELIFCRWVLFGLAVYIIPSNFFKSLIIKLVLNFIKLSHEWTKILSFFFKYFFYKLLGIWKILFVQWTNMVCLGRDISIFLIFLFYFLFKKTFNYLFISYIYFSINQNIFWCNPPTT